MTRRRSGFTDDKCQNLRTYPCIKSVKAALACRPGWRVRGGVWLTLQRLISHPPSLYTILELAHTLSSSISLSHTHSPSPSLSLTLSLSPGLLATSAKSSSSAHSAMNDGKCRYGNHHQKYLQSPFWRKNDAHLHVLHPRPTETTFVINIIVFELVLTFVCNIQFLASLSSVFTA